MVAGALVGVGMQYSLDAPAWSGASWAPVEGGIEVVSTAKPSARLEVGEVYDRAIRDRGKPTESILSLDSTAAVKAVVEQSKNGEVLWFVRASDAQADQPDPVALALLPSSPRARRISPCACIAVIFLALLKMLIVALVFASIVSGVASVGTMGDLRRMGLKTFGYYAITSLMAVLVGQVLVNLIAPGTGAALGLSANAEAGDREENFAEVLRRMVPENVIDSMTSNAAMLQVIFFALLLGYFITRAAEPHSSRVRDLFEAIFHVMMRMAEGVLSLLPYGVFALIVKVVATTGFEPFRALLLYMLTVTLALVLHACVTLPAFLALVGRINPLRWAKAMSPALMTAFSTSSSSMTLPVTMRTVEGRGHVSNKVTSFTLPLGATINMDGTALYECIGVIFLAQYYAGMGGVPLTYGDQALVVMMALLASVGAAGIPSAGLVMMLTILSALKLPVEGAALLLAVDRPLDMLRTTVNVWSDSCGAAVIARSEGEEGPLGAGAVKDEPA